ncbi:unnamed protein product [Protopolystoma xenopodis]|uniref:Uncharacterized protein n=1 Tax=Protopolystoma xenopodis TaxID=117903 RepID=A0A3S5BFX4_9PLAT|nr:unnamed protein product [Protopolystoma xenopodis]
MVSQANSSRSGRCLRAKPALGSRQAGATTHRLVRGLLGHVCGAGGIFCTSIHGSIATQWPDAISLGSFGFSSSEFTLSSFAH